MKDTLRIHQAAGQALQEEPHGGVTRLVSLKPKHHSHRVLDAAMSDSRSATHPLDTENKARMRKTSFGLVERTTRGTFIHCNCMEQRHLSGAAGTAEWNLVPGVCTTNGERLGPSVVRQAKEEELRRLEAMRVSSPVPRCQMHHGGEVGSDTEKCARRTSQASPRCAVNLLDANEISLQAPQGCVQTGGLSGSHWTCHAKSGPHGAGHVIRPFQDGDV